MDTAATAPLALDYDPSAGDPAARRGARPARLILRTVVTTLLLLALALSLLVRYDVALIGQDLRTLVTLRHLRAASPDGPQASITITPMHDGWLRFDLNSD